MMKPTTVISVRGKDRDELLARPDFLYVGRPIYRGKVAWKGSPWANPFKAGMKRGRAVAILGRDLDSVPRADHLDARLAVAFFRAWIVDQPAFAHIGGIPGSVLGCWCCDWSPPELVVTPCHAIALAKMADAIKERRGASLQLDDRAGLPDWRPAKPTEPWVL